MSDGTVPDGKITIGSRVAKSIVDKDENGNQDEDGSKKEEKQQNDKVIPKDKTGKAGTVEKVDGNPKTGDSGISPWVALDTYSFV